MEPAVEHILRLREQPATRAQLRRALSPATAHYAYPLLAPLWSRRPWLREPLLAVAGLAGLLPKISHAPEVPVARFLADLVRAGVVGEHTVESKLVAAVSAPRDRAVTILRSLLTAGHGRLPGLDWGDLLRIVRGWEHQDLEQQRRTRERLLEDFYQHLHRTYDLDSGRGGDGAEAAA